MKQVVFLAFLIMVAGTFWFVWINQASEKIVSAAVPIAFAAVVGIVLSGWIFAPDDDFQVVFPVAFMIDLKTKLELEEPYIFREHRYRFGPSTVKELKARRPDLFPDDLNYFAQNVYQHLLQRSFIDFLVDLYRGSWKAKIRQFDTGATGFGLMGPDPLQEPTSSLILQKQDIERTLEGNWFAQISWRPHPQISLPPGSKLSIKVPQEMGDKNSPSELKIENSKWGSITFTVESVWPVRTVGEYRQMAGLSDEQVRHFATLTYVVRVDVHYNKLRSGDPEIKAFKTWVRQLVDAIRNNFDEEIIWSQVKEDYLRSRHYPPERMTPRGLVPAKK